MAPTGTDPDIIGQWIDEVNLARKTAEITLRPKGTDGRLTTTEIKNLVGQLKGIVAILANADPEDRKAVYNELNLDVVYHKDGHMQVTTRVLTSVSEEDLNSPPPPGIWRRPAVTSVFERHLATTGSAPYR